MGQGGRTRCSHGTSPPWSCHSRRTAVSWAFVWPVTCERSAQPLQYVMCTVHRAHHGAHVHRRRGRTTGARRHAPLSRAAMLALRHLHRACRRPQSAFPPRPSGLRTLTSVVERQRRSDDGGGWKPHEQRGMHRNAPHAIDLVRFKAPPPLPWTQASASPRADGWCLRSKRTHQQMRLM